MRCNWGMSWCKKEACWKRSTHHITEEDIPFDLPPRHFCTEHKFAMEELDRELDAKGVSGTVTWELLGTDPGN